MSIKGGISTLWWWFEKSHEFTLCTKENLMEYSHLQQTNLHWKMYSFPFPVQGPFFQVHRNMHEHSIFSRNFVSHMFNAPRHRKNQINWNAIHYHISTSPKTGPIVLNLVNFSKYSSLRDTNHPCTDFTKGQSPTNLCSIANIETTK